MHSEYSSEEIWRFPVQIIRRENKLSAPGSADGMLMVMAHYDNPNPTGNFLEEEMIGKSVQVNPSPGLLLEVKAARIRGGA